MNKSRTKTKPRTTQTVSRTAKTRSRTSRSASRADKPRSQAAESRTGDAHSPLRSSPSKKHKRLTPLLTAGVIAAGVITGLALPQSTTTADPSSALSTNAVLNGSRAYSANRASAVSESAFETGASLPATGAASASAVGASSVVSSPAAPAAFVTPGSEAKTDPAPLYLDIQQIHFPSATTGWMIQNQDGSLKTERPLELVSTRDGGRTWSTRAMPGQLATGLGFADAKNGWAIVYDRNKATDFTQSSVYARANIVHTADGGKTWQTQWSQASAYAESFPASRRLVVADKSHAYAIVENKLMMLRGDKWTSAAFGQKDFVPQHLSFADARNGWVSGIMPASSGAIDSYEVAVMHTTDGGRTWSKQFAAGGTDENSDTEMLGSRAIDFADRNNGYLLTDDLSMMAGDLYRTSDGGAHWTKAQSKLRAHRPTLTDMDFADGKNGWLSAAPGAGPNEGGLMITRDGGKTFESADGAGYDLSFVQLMKSGSGYAVGGTSMNRDYLVRTDDGGKSWSVLYPALLPTDGLSFVDAKRGYGIGTSAGENRLLTTENGGRTWTPGYEFGSSRRAFAVDFLNANEGWVAAYTNDETSGQTGLDLLHTKDGGRSFTVLSWKPEEDQDTFALDSAALRFSDSLHGTLVYGDATNAIVLSTANGGKSWSYNAHPPKPEAYRYALNGRGDLLSFVGSGQNESVAFFRKSADAPAWSLTGRWAQSRTSPIAFSFPDRDRGYLLTETAGEAPDYTTKLSLLATADGGSSWTAHPIAGGLDVYEYGAKLDFLDARKGWLLTPGRLLTTEDGGLSWKLVDGNDTQK